MSNSIRKREKWREKRRQSREEYRVFSTSRPVSRNGNGRTRHTATEWSTIQKGIYDINNMAVRSDLGGV
ncbi:hypothetical protein ACFWXK_15415 [Streptomyces sp. NPDC059070]|uniref:hypothetical protein n=1 Tax=Streptomyces sp. NPDC059070 TaxID=3346713 RepID=UPI0036957584